MKFSQNSQTIRSGYNTDEQSRQLPTAGIINELFHKMMFNSYDKLNFSSNYEL